MDDRKYNRSIFNGICFRCKKWGNYDFKDTNATHSTIPGIDYYRGMPVGEENGKLIYSSARDIGNIMAGYVAGSNGLSWIIARIGFDGYQYLKTKGIKWTPGRSPTQNAQLVGWKIGFANHLEKR